MVGGLVCLLGLVGCVPNPLCLPGIDLDVVQLQETTRLGMLHSYRTLAKPQAGFVLVWHTVDLWLWVTAKDEPSTFRPLSSVGIETQI